MRIGEVVDVFNRLELGPRSWMVEGDSRGVYAFLAQAGVYRWQLRQTKTPSRTVGLIDFRPVGSRGLTTHLEVVTRTERETGATLLISAPSSWTYTEFIRSSSRVVESAWRASGLYPLHAAGLVTPSGRGVLFVGVSGTGKTTLTIRLVREGWRYLSDDGIGVETSASGVTAWGLRRIFTVVEADLDPRFLGDQSSPASPLWPSEDKAPKRAVFGDLMFPNGFVPSIRPSAVIFLDRDRPSSPDRPDPLPISRSEALAKLIETVTWPHEGSHLLARQLEALRDLAAQCEHFSFNYREHPRPEALSAWFNAL